MKKQKSFEDQYVEQNAPMVAENCIKNYLWHGTDFSETLRGCEDYERTFRNASPEKLSQAVRRILRGFYFADALKDFLEDRRKLVVFPSCKSVKKYLLKEYEYSGTVENLAAFIRTETTNI
ncbi:MAG: hypothetical protein IKZ44_06770 [Clostridia bacterium]|nr:hypothetical protein [Clostridia bacterium]